MSNNSVRPKIKITAHSLVKNEERWIWYSLNSVIDYVDEIMVWDTGSTDHTIDIIKSIASPKIKFNQVNIQASEDHTRFRQQMLEQTQADWLLLLDGDEIWQDQGIAELITAIRSTGRQQEFFVNTYYNLIGDIFHYQEPEAGRYHLGPYQGMYTIRAVNLRLIPGLNFNRPHGQQGMFDDKNTLIQDRNVSPFVLLPTPYLHTTHLRRAGSADSDTAVIKRKNKYKFELGRSFPHGFVYPKVMYLPRPEIVPSPWEKRDFEYSLRAALQTPFKMLKRRLLPNSKSGY